MEESKLDYVPSDLTLEQLIPMLRSGKVFYLKGRSLVSRTFDNYVKIWFDPSGKVHTEVFGKLGSLKSLSIYRTPESMATYLKRATKFGTTVLVERDNLT